MGNPAVLEGVQIDVIASDKVKARYFHGIKDLAVYGFVTFSHDGYWEAPQYINFTKQFIAPRIARPDVMVVRVKPDIVVNVNPVYGRFNALEILADHASTNLLRGKSAGLATKAPDGTTGSTPLITTRP